MAEIQIHTERVDDIPLLIRQQQAMGLPDIIDGIVRRHGNRQGLSLGWLLTGWLAYILSQADHRLSYVEDWAAKQQKTLQMLFPEPVSSQDFTDDRLGDGLRVLSDDSVWTAIETQLNQRLIRVYALPTDIARIDTTTVALYHNPERSELFAFGPSKDHQPDQPQIKVLLTTLDPLAIPLVTSIVAGNQADDGLYLPAIAATRESIGRTGMLYVGDSKMEAFSTRAEVAQAGDYYLMPLSRKGAQGQLLHQWVTQALAEEEVSLISVYAPHDAGSEPKLLAQGQEKHRLQTAMLAGESFQWAERLLLVYSPPLADSGYRGLEKRLQAAETKLQDLTPQPGRGKRPATDLAALQAEVNTILDKHRVANYLQITYREETVERHIRRYQDRPARTETTQRYYLTVARDQSAIETAYRLMGWRLMATNAPLERLSFEQAVLVYRGSVPTIEHDFSRLKGVPLGLRPLLVQRDDHVVGLVRLLSLALRILTLMEFVVRRSLQEEQETLTGLYPGNPKRATSRPSTERLLQAFKGITLSIVQLPGQEIQHVTPLTPLQVRILQLLKFTDFVYTSLAQDEPNST
jgi:transposase